MDNQLEVQPKLKKDGTISHRGEGTGGNSTHGMTAFMTHGDAVLSKRQTERKAYLSDLIRQSEGRAEILHEVATILSLIVFEASAYLLAQDQPDKNLNQLLNSNMRLLLQYLDKYPEPNEAAPPVIEALQKAEQAVQKDWSIIK